MDNCLDNNDYHIDLNLEVSRKNCETPNYQEYPKEEDANYDYQDSMREDSIDYNSGSEETRDVSCAVKFNGVSNNSKNTKKKEGSRA